MKKEIYLKKIRKKLDNTDNYFYNEIEEIIKIVDSTLVDDTLIKINKLEIKLYGIGKNINSFFIRRKKLND